MRVVLDTNVLVRATPGRGGLARRLLLKIIDPPHLLVLSEPILGELAQSDRYPQLRRTHEMIDEAIDDYVADLAQVGHVADVAREMCRGVVAADAADDIIVATALAGRAGDLQPQSASSPPGREDMVRRTRHSCHGRCRATGTIANRVRTTVTPPNCASCREHVRSDLVAG